MDSSSNVKGSLASQNKPIPSSHPIVPVERNPYEPRRPERPSPSDAAPVPPSAGRRARWGAPMSVPGVSDAPERSDSRDRRPDQVDRYPYEPQAVPGDDLSEAPQRHRPQPRPTKDDAQLGESTSRVHEIRSAPPRQVEYEKAPPLIGLAPFLIPLSLGAALTPLSPLSWSYSTWLLFIVPLVITVFAPTRTFSGPLRYAHLEYTSRVMSLLVPLFGKLTETFKSLPTLALPALFLLPIAPVLCFFLLPALPVAWHYITYHYRHRLEEVNTSASKTTVELDLAIARARRAVTLAHTYEKQALDTASTTRRAALLTLKLHHTDFFDTAAVAWASMGTMTTRIGEVVVAAREASNKANVLRHSQSPGPKSHLEILAEGVFERANHALEAASKTENSAREAQTAVALSKNAKTRTDEARQEMEDEVERVRELGTRMSDTVKDVEVRVSKIEHEVEKARAVCEQAIIVAVEGEMAAAEKLVANAKGSLEGAVQHQVEKLCSIVDEARRVWIELAVDT